ncbi:MAG: NADPH-dependent assimilatory sulfite reductase hemoprotein subunit [Roseibacillus sp.]
MSEVKLAKNEGIKTESDYLRGTIVESLNDDSTGAVAKNDEQLLKFHGTYQQDDRDLRKQMKAEGKEKAFSFMIRVRVPGGVSTPQQWIEMDRLTEQFGGNGILKLTTRQAFQVHGIIKGELKQTIKEVNDAAMDTIAACGDVNRNVMVNPNPKISKTHAEVLKHAQAVSDHLTPQTGAYHEIWLDGEKVESSEAEVEPIYGKTYLPRKFKIAFAIPPSNDVDVYANCLSFVAIIEEGELKGYNVLAGGGMGMHHGQAATFPRLADVIGFVTPDKVVDVAENVVKVQRDNGDRSNRKKARLKYTIHDRGVDWFRSELEKYQGFSLEEARPFEFDTNGDAYGWVQDETGAWHCGLYVESGRVMDKVREGLLEIAKIHEGDFRLTGNQNVMVSNISEAKKPEIEALLEQYELDSWKRLSGVKLNALACVALPTCGLSLAEAQRFLPSVIEELETTLESTGLRHDAITMRMTGCPNGCARPYLAEIAMVGKAPNKYNVFLGGGFVGNRLNRLWKEMVPGDELAATLAPLFEEYAKDRNEGEKFGDFVIRKGHVKELTDCTQFNVKDKPVEA